MLEKLKSAVNHFRGLKKRSYSVSFPSSWTSGNWVGNEQLRAYTYSTYVFACVKKRAEKVGELINFKLKKGEREIETHPLINVLYKPNPYQTKNEFWELYQTYKDLTGSAFIYLLKTGEGQNAKLQEMYVLDPTRMKVKMNAEGDIVAYEEHYMGKTKNYRPDEIVFSVYPNPLAKDLIDGLSPLKAGAKSVDTESQLVDYQYRVLKNGGKIEGILRFKSEYLTDQQIKEIQEKFAEKYAEAKNSGRPLVMYGEGDYENLGLSPAELSFLESKKAVRDDILVLYSVPKTVLGLSEDMSRANTSEANRYFIAETIVPLIDNIIQKLNEFVVPQDMELYFFDPTPADIETNIKMVDSGTRNFYMTTNEKRRLMKLEDLTGLDDILVPFNLTTIDDLNQPLDLDKGLKKKL